MKLLYTLGISLLITNLLVSVNADYLQTKDAFIDNIIDNFLREPINDEKVYRNQLATKIFDALVKRYPDQSFFVNVYSPIMGYQNHVMTGFDHYSRLHKRNDNRFNVYVGHVDKSNKNINDHLTEQKLEYVKSTCAIRDCGNAI